jgi:maltodextrin utilization protein YvdJ
MAFNIQREKALSIALIIHGVSFFPVIIMGAYFLWIDKFSLSEIRSKSSREGSSPE